MALNDVERWQDWLSQINNDLSTVYLYRAIWTTMAQTIDGNLTIPRTCGGWPTWAGTPSRSPGS